MDGGSNTMEGGKSQERFPGFCPRVSGGMVEPLSETEDIRHKRIELERQERMQV